MLSFLLCLSYFSYVLSSTPTPDTTPECLACQDYVESLEIKWTNETQVEEILADLQKKCDAEYHAIKKEICYGVVGIFVQIPPGIFEGLNDLAWPVPIASCATLEKCHVNCCAESSPPEQIHLSLASDDHSIMGVSWVTLAGEESHVRYGTHPDDLSMVVDGTVLTYTKAGWVGVIHRAIMTGLKLGTTYYYQVGADDNSGWSEVYAFNTIGEGKEINFAVIADMAYDTLSDDTVASMIRMVDAGQIDVVIHSGDISYADGYMPHFDDFMNKIQPIATRIPYQVAPGNHEFGYNFTAYKCRFFMPGQIDEGGSGDGMFYSWNYGGIHFAALNSESPIDTPMFTDYEKKWAQKDLARVDRSVTPWVIAHFHRPFYCARDEECGTILRNQGLEELMYKNKVDAVLVGHEHTYERTFPVYNFTKTDGAPVYLMQGASGNREGNNGAYPSLDQLPEWIASAHNDIGFGILTLSADGQTLKWGFYASAGENAELDYVTWTK